MLSMLTSHYQRLKSYRNEILKRNPANERPSITMALAGYWSSETLAAPLGRDDTDAKKVGGDPIRWTVRLRYFLSSVLRSSFFFEEKDWVWALLNTACSFQSHLWTRSLRPQGRQRPHALFVGAKRVRVG
jgi:hypothetical protein